MYLPLSDWFLTKRTSVWFQINRKMVNTIWFWVDLIRFRKVFSVCTLSQLDLRFMSIWQEYDRTDNFRLIMNQTEFHLVRNQAENIKTKERLLLRGSIRSYSPIIWKETKIVFCEFGIFYRRILHATYINCRIYFAATCGWILYILLPTCGWFLYILYILRQLAVEFYISYIFCGNLWYNFIYFVANLRLNFIYYIYFVGNLRL